MEAYNPDLYDVLGTGASCMTAALSLLPLRGVTKHSYPLQHRATTNVPNNPDLGVCTAGIGTSP